MAFPPSAAWSQHTGSFAPPHRRDAQGRAHPSGTCTPEAARRVDDSSERHAPQRSSTTRRPMNVALTHAHVASWTYGAHKRVLATGLNGTGNGTHS